MFLPSRTEGARDCHERIVVISYFRISKNIIDRSALDSFSSEIIKTVRFDGL